MQFYYLLVCVLMLASPSHQATDVPQPSDSVVCDNQCASRNDVEEITRVQYNDLEQTVRRLYISFVRFYIERIGRSGIDNCLLEGNSTSVFEYLSNLTEQQNSMGSSDNPGLSCQDLYTAMKPSGYYWIRSGPSNPAAMVYCDMERTCCGRRGGWMKVADIDMTNSTHQCPVGFKLITRTTPPYRTCGRPDHLSGCMSTTFGTNGVRYSRVCGRILGYQIGSPNAFHGHAVIDSYYVDGISLTHGQSPRKHIWSFAGAVNEASNYAFSTCPCSNSGVGYSGAVPSFVGNDYFCDSAIGGDSLYSIGQFYPSDPLWDGQGCGATSTCCEFNSPPWFCKQLPQPTTDDIELRLCDNEWNSFDDSPFDVVELFVN